MEEILAVFLHPFLSCWSEAGYALLIVEFSAKKQDSQHAFRSGKRPEPVVPCQPNVITYWQPATTGTAQLTSVWLHQSFRFSCWKDAHLLY